MKRREFIAASLTTAAVVGFDGTNALNDTARAAETKKSMNILVLTGSPRKNGNSAALATQFIKGAEEAGHTVARFDAAFKTVHPCTACNSCGMDGPCVFQDDFEFVREHIIPADLVAFATPLYYFGFSSQLKAVIDRFYAINGSIHVAKKAVLLMTYANTSAREASPIKTHYEVLLEYMGWTDAGRVIAPGVWPAGAVNRTEYPRLAYELGRSL
ncbi:MAG: flavodoxin family protein [Desulfovibrionaceae bacterium]|nr:flavodoxin family protein [Desulfovibrionaceae bacterium]